MEPSLCLVADILGFRQIVLRTEGNYQRDLVDRWVDVVDRLTESNALPRYQLISDSLFVVADQRAEGFKALLGLCRGILDEGLSIGLPIRGAITRGQVQWNERIAHGPAIVAAYELGNACEWVGIVCDYAFPEARALFDYADLVSYPAPTKTGSIRERPCVVWSIPADDELFRLCGVPRRGGHVNSGALTKLRNTAAFRDHVERAAAQGGGNPARYPGLV